MIDNVISARIQDFELKPERAGSRSKVSQLGFCKGIRWVHEGGHDSVRGH